MRTFLIASALALTAVGLSGSSNAQEKQPSLANPASVRWSLIFGSMNAPEKQAVIPSITVVGSDHVSAKPDMAEIQVGVNTQAPTAAAALKENNEAMEKLFRTLAAKGIAEKDRQTSNFNVSPRYRNPKPGEEQSQIVGYQVSNTVHVKVRELSALGGILDELVSAGANQVHGVNFTVAEPQQLLDVARRKAVINARHKAELYAQAENIKVGRVLLIEEATPHLPRPLAADGMMARAAAVPIATGEMDFHASITVTYEIAR
jgi:uncharacterized protein YggE